MKKGGKGGGGRPYPSLVRYSGSLSGSTIGVLQYVAFLPYYIGSADMYTKKSNIPQGGCFGNNMLHYTVREGETISYFLRTYP